MFLVFSDASLKKILLSLTRKSGFFLLPGFVYLIITSSALK